MSTRTFTLNTGARRVTLIVTEAPTRVFLGLTMSRYGEFGDDAQIREWMAGIIVPYDVDPRPFVTVNPCSGETATIGDGFAVIEPPAARETAS